MWFHINLIWLLKTRFPGKTPEDLVYTIRLSIFRLYDGHVTSKPNPPPRNLILTVILLAGLTYSVASCSGASHFPSGFVSFFVAFQFTALFIVLLKFYSPWKYAWLFMFIWFLQQV
jgi:hypothetical protein